MRLCRSKSIVVALLAPLVFASPARAETVHFPSATSPPTPLQQRLARERAQPIPPPPSAQLTGEFYRPAGAGPFPALVSLHGCAGRSPKEREDASSARFVALGYAVLIVDSFGPRGISEGCTGSAPSADRIMDAYGGLHYLAGLPFIDPDRIAVIGYSQGAIAALAAVGRDGIQTLFERHFRAAIAYYPLCDPSPFAVAAATLILIGDLDDWTPARRCREMMAKRTGEGAPLRLVVYPGAYHSFAAVGLRDKPTTSFGHHVEYNEAADRAAWTETTAALREAFGR